jgi:hypothetical protein
MLLVRPCRTSVSGGDSFHVSICGTSQGGYTENTGTDWHNQLWKKLFVPMVVAWDSQIVITEPDEQGVDDVDEEDSADEQ